MTRVNTFHGAISSDDARAPPAGSRNAARLCLLERIGPAIRAALAAERLAAEEVLTGSEYHAPAVWSPR